MLTHLQCPNTSCFLSLLYVKPSLELISRDRQPQVSAPGRYVSRLLAPRRARGKCFALSSWTSCTAVRCRLTRELYTVARLESAPVLTLTASRVRTRPGHRSYASRVSRAGKVDFHPWGWSSKGLGRHRI